MSWVDYWSKLAYDADAWRISMAEYVHALDAALPIDTGWRVLDYGAGPGFIAPALAPRVSELWLADPSAELLSTARENSVNHPNVTLRAIPEASAASLPEAHFDLIIFNSVLQYLKKDQASSIFSRFAPLLAPGGRIVVSDIVPAHLSLLKDAWPVLGFYRRSFGTLAALRYGLSELRNRSQRSHLSFHRYERDEFESLVAETYTLRWIPNLTISKARWSAILEPVASS
jgi:SAM-dependent methyltransferase